MTRLLVAIVLSACASSCVAPAADPALEKLQPVDVRAVRAANGAAALVIRASSGGCTSADHFDVRLSGDGGAQRVSVRRTKQDPCKAHLPDGVTLRLDVPGLRADAPIFLENPRFLPLEG